MNPLIPAIMPQSYRDMEKHVDHIVGLVDMVQLDLMDGVFVPDKTWPFKEFKSKRPKMDFITDLPWQELQTDDLGLPHWQEVDYELDLMIQDADVYLDHWIALGPKRIIFHLESLQDVEKLLNEVQGIRSLIEIGLAISNDTSVDALLPHLEMIDCVQVMGIARIGFQGEPLDERVFEKITSIKIHAPFMPIQVDGSVHTATVEIFRDAGIERFVAGSAIFEGTDIPGNVKALGDLIG